MPEHRIHLRKAWENVAEGADGLNGVTRIDLPLVTGPTAGTLRLVRRFQRPATDAATERLGILLERVPGLTAVTLNAETVWTGRADATTRLDLDWPPTAERRCVLSIEAEIEPEQSHDWGYVVIVIRGKKDGGGK